MKKTSHPLRTALLLPVQWEHIAHPRELCLWVLLLEIQVNSFWKKKNYLVVKSQKKNLVHRAVLVLKGAVGGGGGSHIVSAREWGQQIYRNNSREIYKKSVTTFLPLKSSFLSVSKSKFRHVAMKYLGGISGPSGRGVITGDQTPWDDLNGFCCHRQFKPSPPSKHEPLLRAAILMPPKVERQGMSVGG